MLPIDTHLVGALGTFCDGSTDLVSSSHDRERRDARETLGRVFLRAMTSEPQSSFARESSGDAAASAPRTADGVEVAPPVSDPELTTILTNTIAPEDVGAISDEAFARLVTQQLNSTGRKRRAPVDVFVPAPLKPQAARSSGAKKPRRANTSSSSKSARTTAPAKKHKKPAAARARKPRPRPTPSKNATPRRNVKPEQCAKEEADEDDEKGDEEETNETNGEKLQAEEEERVAGAGRPVEPVENPPTDPIPDPVPDPVPDPAMNLPASTVLALPAPAPPHPPSARRLSPEPIFDENWQSRVPTRELPPPDGFRAGDVVWALLRGIRKKGKGKSTGGKGKPSTAASSSAGSAGASEDDPGTCWWPGRVWKLRHCQRTEALWRSRGAPPSTPRALIRCFGDGSFAWAGIGELERYAGDDEQTRERSESRSLGLLSQAGTRSRRGEGGVRVYPSVARRALREAEEGAMMDWDPPWSESEAEDDDGDGEGDGHGPAGAYRPFEPREDGEKDGLTPDWIIDAGCRIFGLNLPTVDEPIIRGLLDPCTNSNRRPNIPAEKTYDRRQDGLKQENPWKGYYVILNPSYESSVQWRFINRAINEVEWGFCPGILMVCRNSTDTSYFQRLLPFPRVFLRRDAIRFKDYDHTPIGFGIAVFCLVSPTKPKSEKMAIYARFYDEFRHAGEFNVPFDRAFLEHPEFEALTDRLHVDSAIRFRDSWVACDECDRWREIPPTQSLAQVGAQKTWRCRDAFPALGCDAPLTPREYKAFSVARKGQAIALKADKQGTDILGSAAQDENANAHRLPGPEEGRDEMVDGEMEDDGEEEKEEEEAEKEDGWRKAEKTEEQTRDFGDEDLDEDSDEDPYEAREGDIAATPVAVEPPSDVVPDVWLDEVSLRGGRKRFAVEEAPVRARRPDPRRDGARGASHPAGCRCSAIRCRERRSKALIARGANASASGAVAALDLLDRPAWMGAREAERESGKLSAFERERLEKIRKNREKLRALLPASAEEKAAAAIARAAQASSALAAAGRLLRSAEAKRVKAETAAAEATRRARAAAAASSVADRESHAAETAATDALAESLAARAMVQKLAERAAAADAEADAAEAALPRDVEDENPEA